MLRSSHSYKNGIVFKHVQKLADNQYMFPLSVGEIKKLKNANKLQIIPELQRNYKKDKYGELKTKVNKKSAREIANLINNGEFFYNGIRFNLMDDGEADPPVYNEDNETLTITSGTIIVPDGNHRSIACELSTKHQDDKFGIFFTYLTSTGYGISTSDKLKPLFYKALALSKEVQIYFRTCENKYNDMQKICTIYHIPLFYKKKRYAHYVKTTHFYLF